MHGHKKGRGGHNNELKGPQTDMGDGEEVIIAYTVATRLLCVARKRRLLIPPYTFCSHHEDHDAKDEDH
uniref:Uncharacterized protein n=1 Tax=Xenopus tropicalis TaxID=8364 RepID=A0A6I8SNQ7_XENTR